MSPNARLSLAPGAIQPFVMELVDALNAQGHLPAMLEMYIDRGEIETHRFTPAIKMAMLDYLLDRGMIIDDVDRLNAGEYDEHFALAYHHAVNVAGGGDDPVDNARRPGGGSTSGAWDFSVDTFEHMEQQGIIRENILAAGALDYIYELGDRLGIFKVVDVLVLNWSAGVIDVVDGPAAAKLYRYWKMRDQRATDEERAMVYRRVLDKGPGNVLSRMVANEPFPQLWHRLMSEVADYINKSEGLSEGLSDTSPVSRSRIHQAARDLQINLTEYCTGMAHMQIREFHAQLQECFEILQQPEVIAYFGGLRRKTLWSVVETIARQEFGIAVNAAAHRSLAVEGNRVFRWLGEFDAGTDRHDDFTRMLRAAESYIINYAGVEDHREPWGAGRPDDDFDDFDQVEKDAFAELDDDF